MLSFCDLNFVMKHFKFLKTVTGKGVFNLFLSSMFLVGNGSSIWGWLMFGCFAIFGVFFTLIGCAVLKGYDDADIKSDEVKGAAKDALNQSSRGDKSHLLDEA